MSTIPFSQIPTSDIIIDNIYEWGPIKNKAGEPICKLLPKLVGNGGGFRPVKIKATTLPKVIALFTDGFHLDWPDELDKTTGIFTYFGDNRKPGPLNGKSGNKVLETVFDLLHSRNRSTIPPFFLFKKTINPSGVEFIGLAVPGVANLPMTEDLIAIWRTSNNIRFQNYKAHFTVLDVNVIKREWINDIINGNVISSVHCPVVWKNWINRGIYKPLISPSNKKIARTKVDQLPASSDKLGWDMIKAIHNHFPQKKDAHRFEKTAANIFQYMDSNVLSLVVTRAAVDGGRDAIGEYRIGNNTNGHDFEFNLEAKCYNPGKNSVGVKETSRLISRIKHRMFGVLVTTSFVAQQAYQEILDDRHPIIIITARDIVDTLRYKMNINDLKKLNDWLLQY